LLECLFSILGVDIPSMELLVHVVILLNFFFGGTRILTQGFMLARQALYCLSNLPSLFCSGYFRDKLSLFCPGWSGPQSFYFVVPAMTGMRHMLPCPASFPGDRASQTLFFFFCPGWPGTTILLISASQSTWDYRHEPLCWLC
jgi:hypothetical protein